MNFNNITFTDMEKKDFVVDIPQYASSASEAETSKPNRGTVAIGPQITNSPALSIIAYCLSSISMTVVNKYVVSGSFWNLNFLYLAIQAVVSVATITLAKQLGMIKALAPFDVDKARKCEYPHPKKSS